MLQSLKKKVKDQKGMTLIELLAVIVILGIIAAIAIPSILGLIDNSKKDAHVANAQQMLNAAKMAIASDATLQTGPHFLTLNDLETKNYLDPVDSPDSLAYSKGTTLSAADSTVSYVQIQDGKVVGVNLIEVAGTGKRGISVIKTDGTSVSSKDFNRGLVSP